LIVYISRLQNVIEPDANPKNRPKRPKYISKGPKKGKKCPNGTELKTKR